MNTEKEKRIEFLKKEIEKQITDAEYDALKEELKKLLYKDYNNEEIEDGTLNSVGYTILDEFKKVEHKLPMISLNNGFSEEDLKNLMKDVIDYNLYLFINVIIYYICCFLKKIVYNSCILIIYLYLCQKMKIQYKMKNQWLEINQIQKRYQ